MNNLESQIPAAAASDQQHLAGHTTLAPDVANGGLGSSPNSGHPSIHNTSRTLRGSSMSLPIGDGDYSTVLGATIAIGLSLLILNVLVFGGVYYKLHRGRRQQHTSKNQPSLSNSGSLSRGSLRKSPSQRHRTDVDYVDVPQQTSFAIQKSAAAEAFDCFGEVGVGPSAGTICITYARDASSLSDGSCCQLKTTGSANNCPGCATYGNNCCSDLTSESLCDSKTCALTAAGLQSIEEMDEHL